MRVIGGDIGGTHTRLAMFEVGSAALEMVAERTVPSRDRDGLDPIVRAFLRDNGGECQRAVFGIAGPITGRKMETTNLPWTVDADRIEREIGIERVRLLNDLEATGWGLAEVSTDSTPTLALGRPDARGNGAVIAAGTGLGEAGMYWDGGRHRPFACEGGHASFAPVDDEQDRLLAFMRSRHLHVSWERVVSGPGLVSVFEFVVHDERVEVPEWFEIAGKDGDQAAAIAERAFSGDSPAAERALRLFVRLYGAEAGNLALKMMATGGLWIAGGIAPKIRPALERWGFMDAFLAKGRMQPLLERMPVRLVLDDRTALFGAARCAAEL
jgi:glucokinase